MYLFSPTPNQLSKLFLSIFKLIKHSIHSIFLETFLLWPSDLLPSSLVACWGCRISYYIFNIILGFFITTLLSWMPCFLNTISIFLASFKWNTFSQVVSWGKGLWVKVLRPWLSENSINLPTHLIISLTSHRLSNFLLNLEAIATVFSTMQYSVGEDRSLLDFLFSVGILFLLPLWKLLGFFSLPLFFEISTVLSCHRCVWICGIKN